MATESNKEGILVSAAKALGSAAGKLASLTGVTAKTDAASKPAAHGKLPKKHKHRLPRREKKALQAKEKRAAQAPALNL